MYKTKNENFWAALLNVHQGATDRNSASIANLVVEKIQIL
jgi:hypothetical protein